MNQRIKTILLGAGVGALVGLTLAWVITDNSSDEKGNALQRSPISSGDFFQLAMGILSLATQFNTVVKKP